MFTNSVVRDSCYALLDDCDIFVAKFYSSLHYCAFEFWTSKLLDLTFPVFLSTFQEIILTPKLYFEKSCHNIPQTFKRLTKNKLTVPVPNSPKVLSCHEKTCTVTTK